MTYIPMWAFVIQAALDLLVLCWFVWTIAHLPIRFR